MVTWEVSYCSAKSTTTTRPSRRSNSRIALCRSSFSIQNFVAPTYGRSALEDTLGTSLLSRMAFACLGEKFQSGSSDWQDAEPRHRSCHCETRLQLGPCHSGRAPTSRCLSNSAESVAFGPCTLPKSSVYAIDKPQSARASPSKYERTIGRSSGWGSHAPIRWVFHVATGPIG